MKMNLYSLTYFIKDYILRLKKQLEYFNEEYSDLIINDDVLLNKKLQLESDISNFEELYQCLKDSAMPDTRTVFEIFK